MTDNQKNILDVIRIIAALLVMIGHSFSFYQVTVFKDDTYFPRIQAIGVVIFFILSGFLTVMSIERKSADTSYGFKKYLKHKLKRILVEYYPALLLIAMVDAISIIINGNGYQYYNAFNIKQFIGNMLFLQVTGINNIPHIEIIPFGSARQLWTLSVEWWLYMVFGYAYIHIHNRKILRFSNGFPFIVMLLFVIEYLIDGRGNGLGFVFFLGVLLHYIYERVDISFSRHFLPIVIAVYILYGIVYKDAYTIYSFIFMAIIICMSLNLTEKNGTRNKALEFCSKCTFMLYLVHYSIIDLFNSLYMNKYHSHLYVFFFVGVVVSIVVSISLYVLSTKIKSILEKRGLV